MRSRSTPNILAVQTNTQSSKSASSSNDSTVSVTPPSGRKSHLETTPNTVPHLCCSPSILPPAETPTRATETMHRTATNVSDLPTSQTPSQTSARSSPPSVPDTLNLHRPQRTLHSIAPLRLQYQNQVHKYFISIIFKICLLKKRHVVSSVVSPRISHFPLVTWLLNHI